MDLCRLRTRPAAGLNSRRRERPRRICFAGRRLSRKTLHEPTLVDGRRCTIIVTDAENQPLAHFKLVGDRYEGQSTSGTPMTLSR